MQEMALRINSSFTSIVLLSIAFTSVETKSWMFFSSLIKFPAAYYSSVERLANNFTILVMASSMFPALNSSYFFALASLGISCIELAP